MNKVNFIKLKKSLLVILSSFILIVSIVGVQTSEAGFFCGGIGTKGMTPKTQVLNVDNTLLPDLGNRKYTIEELFGTGASSFGIPMGSNTEHWLGLKGNTIIKDEVGDLTKEQEERLKLHGDTILCATYGFQPSIQNVSKTMATSVASVVKFTTTSFFDNKFICQDPENPSGNCINLLKIVGGTEGSDGGLLGVFSKGFFLPLSTIAFIITAIWMIWKGLIKREFRATLGGLAWAIFAFMLGIFVLTKPWMFARLPQTVNTSISACLLDAMNGHSCLDGFNNGSQQDLLVPSVCVSTSNSTEDYNDEMQLSLNGLTCTITKGFTIDSWAREQFGYSFNELYTENAPKGYENYPADKLQGSPNDYCVNMYSNDSPNELLKSSNPTFTDVGPDSKVCNIALAYMSNRTIGNFGTNAKMEHIIATAAKDERMWSAFSGEGRDLIGFFNLLGIIAAAVCFIPITLYGHAYSLTATVLVIFAPLFVLFAIHPGKGKKIFLGWLESIVSACLKFMATGLLIMIMILIYSAILSTLPSFLLFVVSLILCFTFITYRKELVEMIGKTSMGGTAVSNKFAGGFEKGRQKIGHVGNSLAGGAMGGAIAGAVQNKEDGLKGIAKGLGKGAGMGAGKGLAMEMKRGRGTVANMVRQGSQVNRQLKAEKDTFNKERFNANERQETMNMLDKQTGKVTAAVSSASIRDERLKQQNIVQDAINSVSIPSVQSQLQQSVIDFENDKTRNALSARTNITNKQVFEANRLAEVHISGNGQQTKDAYIDNMRSNAEQQMNKSINNIQANEAFIQLSENDKKDILDKFTMNETNLINDRVKQLQDNITLISDNEGRTEINEINLIRNNEIREEMLDNDNERYNKTIAEIQNKLEDATTKEKKNGLPDLDDFN